MYYETSHDYFHPYTDSVGDDEFVNGELFRLYRHLRRRIHREQLVMPHPVRILLQGNRKEVVSVDPRGRLGRHHIGQDAKLDVDLAVFFGDGLRERRQPAVENHGKVVIRENAVGNFLVYRARKETDVGMKTAQLLFSIDRNSRNGVADGNYVFPVSAYGGGNVLIAETRQLLELVCHQAEVYNHPARRSD